MSLGKPALAAPETMAGKGRASWYGTTSHGKQTANGEIYNKFAMTAAHKAVPFGTVLRVYNLRNGRHVLVRVNDRGPFVEGRIVDLSFRAANALRMANSGVIAVALEVVSHTDGKPLNAKNAFYVHLADEKNPLIGMARAASLEKKLGVPLNVFFSLRGKNPSHAICAGPYQTFDEAHEAFLAMEALEQTLLGIIEGPLKGAELPHLSPPGHREKPRRDKSPVAEAADLFIEQVASVSAALPQTVLDMQRGFAFTLFKSLVPGLTDGAQAPAVTAGRNDVRG
jgi:rare lipoprotein A